ncbi:hypothetical protein Acsp05_18090 [Actinokineospora sp. NBRC 105648]|nr:hypothetical protein Acsp05_18090 [Actinokineospora sp. NBRC 105648]
MPTEDGGSGRITGGIRSEASLVIPMDLARMPCRHRNNETVAEFGNELPGNHQVPQRQPDLPFVMACSKQHNTFAASASHRLLRRRTTPVGTSAENRSDRTSGTTRAPNNDTQC